MGANREAWEAVTATLERMRGSLAGLVSDFADMKRKLEEALETPEDAAKREEAVAALNTFAEEISAFDQAYPATPELPPEEPEA